ncbi:MAG: hypothetical protein IJ088_02970 [Clostridia bacterium]|nr:hypothetical protein [Clostridia bacterium]
MRQNAPFFYGGDFLSGLSLWKRGFAFLSANSVYHDHDKKVNIEISRTGSILFRIFGRIQMYPNRFTSRSFLQQGSLLFFVLKTLFVSTNMRTATCHETLRFLLEQERYRKSREDYDSLASQITSDFGRIERSLKTHMFHKIKGLTDEAPKGVKVSANDAKFLKSKQTRYLHGQMVHPIGYVKYRIPQMPNKEVCNYTVSGRARQNIQVGAPEAILSWLARHTPPDMPVEEADNRISAFSAQKGNCSVFGIPLEVGGVVVLHKNPYLGKDVSRYRNLTLVCVRAERIINEPDPSVARSLLVGLKIDQKTIKTINKLRKNRNYSTL